MNRYNGIIKFHDFPLLFSDSMIFQDWKTKFCIPGFQERVRGLPIYQVLVIIIIIIVINNIKVRPVVHAIYQVLAIMGLEGCLTHLQICGNLTLAILWIKRMFSRRPLP